MGKFTRSHVRTLFCYITLEAPAHWVWADPTRLRQVFWNLLTNAVKFTPEGGRIIVRTSGEGADRLLVEVTDTGIGIDEELARRVFDAFEQGERSVTRQFGGLGLGLAITRTLVSLHHGTIAVRSEGRGKGASFVVDLPAFAEAPAPAESAPTAPARSSSLHILLVDDNADTRRVLARLLARLGHRVETAPDVKSSLAFLSQAHFDVLVSDIGLPDGSGLDLMREARQRHPDLRGIALSGFGMEEDSRRSAEAGFDVHLIKPVDFAILEEALSSGG